MKKNGDKFTCKRDFNDIISKLSHASRKKEMNIYLTMYKFEYQKMVLVSHKTPSARNTATAILQVWKHEHQILTCTLWKHCS